MNWFELTGTIYRIFETQTFPSGFTKREFILLTDDAYPQKIRFECLKERCALLDGVREGDHVSVSFRIRGSEYNDRFFVNLQAQEVVLTGAEPGATNGRLPEGKEGRDLEKKGDAPPPRPPEEGEDMPF